MKEMWETVKLYKIKTIFDRSATQNDGKALLDFESFVSIFSEFVQYHSVTGMLL